MNTPGRLRLSDKILAPTLARVIQTDQALAVSHNPAEEHVTLAVNPAYLNTLALNVQIADLQAVKVDKATEITCEQGLEASLNLTATPIQLSLAPFVKNSFSTGLLGGGALSSPDNLTVTVQAGSGLIAQLGSAPPSLVTWNTLTGIVPQQQPQQCSVVYFALDQNGNVQQNNQPNEWFLKQFILVGRCLVDDTGAIVECVSVASVKFNESAQFFGFLANVGLLNLDTPSFNGQQGTLNLSYNGGRLFGYGISPANSFEPNILYAANANPATFMLATRSRIINAAETNVPAALVYDDSGTLEVNQSDAFSAYNLRLFALISGQLLLQYGQQIYQNLAMAKANAAANEGFALHPWVSNRNHAVLLGVISITKSCASFSDYEQFQITWADVWGRLVNFQNTYVDVGTYQEIVGTKVFSSLNIGGYDQPLSMRKVNPTSNGPNALAFAYQCKSSDNSTPNYASTTVEFLNTTHNEEEARMQLQCMHEGNNSMFLQAQDGHVEMQGKFNLFGSVNLTDDVGQGGPVSCHGIISQVEVTPAALFQQAPYDPAASSDQFPSQTDNGKPIKAGQTWMALSSGTVQGVPIGGGQVVRALVDEPGQLVSNWAVDTPTDMTNTSCFANEFIGLNLIQRSLVSGMELAPGIVLPALANLASLNGFAFSQDTHVDEAASILAGSFVQQTLGNNAIGKNYAMLAIGQVFPTPAVVSQEIGYGIANFFGASRDAAGPGTGSQLLYGIKDETPSVRGVQNFLNKLSLGQGTADIGDETVALQIGANRKASVALFQLTGLTSGEIAGLDSNLLSDGLMAYNAQTEQLKIRVGGVWKTITVTEKRIR